MTKFLLPFLVLFFLSCKESKKVNADTRHALIANINYENSLLTYSYWKDEHYAIKIENLNNGKIIFSQKIKDNCFTEPRIKDERLYFPESNDIFTCLDYKTKKVIWKINTQGRIRTFQFVSKNIIILSIDVYGLVAINIETGKVIYELLLHSDKNCTVDFAPNPIAFDEKNFYVVNFNCISVAAYDIASGKSIWNKKEDSKISNFIVNDQYVFIGSQFNNGKNELLLLEAKTGKEIFRNSSSFNIFIDPVVYKNKIYYQTEDSQLQEFDIESKIIKSVFKTQSNLLGCSQMFQIGHYLYIQDCDYNVNKIDLQNSKREIVYKGQKGLLGVYKINNETKFIY